MISITPGLGIEDIQLAFQSCLLLPTTKIEISLDIHKREQTQILSCISDQIQMLTNLQDFTLVFENHCWIEDYSALERALQNLKSLNSFSVEFKDNCFASEKGIEWIAQGVQHSLNINAISINMSKLNCANLAVVQSISNCIQNLSKLQTFSLAIEKENQFSDDGILLLSEGLKKCSNIQELTLTLDFSNIGAQGVTALSHILSHLENITGIDFKINCKKNQLVNLYQIFNSISSKINLKKLKLNFQKTQQIKQEDELAFVNCLKNLINLEEFSLFGLLNLRQHQSCYEILKILSSSPSNNLQNLSMNIYNFKEDIESLSTKQFEDLRNIKKIEFRFQCFSSENQENLFLRDLSACFINMRELTKLNLLFMNELKTQDFQYFCEQLRYLESLSFLSIEYRYNLSNQAFFYLRNSIQILSNLSELHLKIRASSKNTNNYMFQISNLKKLTLQIFKSRRGIESFRPSLFTNLQNLINLDYLFLQFDDCIIPEKQQSEFFEQISHFVQLKTMNINFKITGSTEIVHQMKKTFTDLRVLEDLTMSIRKCSVTDCNKLFTSFENTSLKRLKITLNISEENKMLQEKDEVLPCFLKYLKDLTLILFNYDEQTIEDFLVGLQMFKSLQNFQFILKHSCIENEGDNLFNMLSRYLHGNVNILKLVLVIETSYSFEVQERGNKLIGESIATLRNLKYLSIKLPQMLEVSYPIMSHIKHLQNLKQIEYTSSQSSNFAEITISNLEKCLSFQSSQSHQEREQLKVDLESDQNVVRMFEQIKFFNSPQRLSLEFDNKTADELQNLGYLLQQINTLSELSIYILKEDSLSLESLLSLQKGISKQNSLTQLTLSIVGVGQIDFVILLEGLQQLSELTHLLLFLPFTLNNNSFQVLGKCTSEMKNLRRLELKSEIKRDQPSITNQNGINEMLEIYNSLPQCNKLKNLDIHISKTQILDLIGVESLNKGLESLTNLKVLNIGFILGEGQYYSDEIILDLSKALKKNYFLKKLQLEIKNQINKNFNIMHTLTSAIDSHDHLKQVEIKTFEDFDKYPFQMRNLLIKLRKQEGVILKIENQCVLLMLYGKLDLRIKLNQRISEDTLNIIMEGISSIPSEFITLLNFSNILSNQAFTNIIKEKVSKLELSHLELFIEENNNLEENVWNILDSVNEIKGLRTLGLYIDCDSPPLEKIKQLVCNLNRTQNLQKTVFVNVINLIENKDTSILRFSKIIVELSNIKSLKTINYNFIDRVSNSIIMGMNTLNLAYKLQPRLVKFNKSNNNSIQSMKIQLQM